jgi:hypothetical protein
MDAKRRMLGAAVPQGDLEELRGVPEATLKTVP